jgi:UDP-N-acetylglucosamine 2-epimerase (non-hydrolysing)
MRSSPSVHVVLVSTGQHERVLDEVLGLFDLVPDYRLRLMRPGQTVAQLFARCVMAIEPVIDAVKPDLTVVQGDTTSATAAAFASFSAHVPVWHVEAGLRTSTPTLPFPEEMNRRLIARLASLHLAPTAGAAANLRHEGVSDGDVVVTGNSGIDALLFVHGLHLAIGHSELTDFLAGDGPLVVITMHRRENWVTGLKVVAEAARALCTRVPGVRIVHVTHPNPAVAEAVRRHIGHQRNILVVPPLGYADFVGLLARADVIITDSGGIQEEAPYLSVPVVVVREETERTEGVDAGLAHVVGLDRERIVAQVQTTLAQRRRPPADGVSAPYGDGRASDRIVALLERFGLPTEPQAA